MTRSSSIALPAALLAAGALVLLTAGCGTTPTVSPMMEQSPRVTGTAAELRLKIRTYAATYGAIIEGASDEIFYSSMDALDEDPLVSALLWKTQAIPMAHAACLHSDPLAALIDAWALAIQMRLHFSEGEGGDVFAEHQHVALEACHEIEEDLEAIAVSVLIDGDASQERERIEEWAREHPISGRWLARPSVLPEIAHLVTPKDVGPLAAVGKLSEDLSDLSMRISLYNAFLPKQARWQAELLAMELGVPKTLDLTDRFLPTLTEMAVQAERTLVELPELLERERAVFLDAAQAQIDALQAFFQAERTEILEAVALETEAMISAVEELAEREREAAIDALRAQWPVVRDDVVELSPRVAAASLEPLRGLVDHAALRIAQLGAAALVVLLLCALVLVRVARR